MDPAQQRRLAVDLFNATWTLLDKPDRTPRETDLMVHSAHASRYLWDAIGEPVHHVRGEWQVSRAYAVAGRAEPALHHAQACLAICEEHGIGDFDIAFAHEALARAHALSGHDAEAIEHEQRARSLAELIADKEDRNLVLADLRTIR